MFIDARKLATVQRRDNLNSIFAIDQPGLNNACHKYAIAKRDSGEELVTIQFQCGSRFDENSVHGVVDADLLEIVRDRLTSFQRSDSSSREIARALNHIEEALIWMNRRIEGFTERQDFGTCNK